MVLNNIIMDYIGYINTEGGPLIIADSKAINNWDGIDGDDYEQLCSVYDSDLSLEGFPVAFKDYSSITWELDGGGVVRIYRDKDDIYLIKSWVTDDKQNIDDTDLLTIPASKEQLNIGNLRLYTRYVIIFWATESLYNVEFDHKKQSGVPNGSFAIDNSILFFKTLVKEYDCIYDEINVKGNFVRRLHLKPLK